jgi:hypothetical protein
MAATRPPADPLAPEVSDDEHVGKPGERGPVGDDSPEGNLAATLVVRAERERVVDGPVQDGSGDAGGPVGVVVEEPVDQGAVELSAVG